VFRRKTGYTQHILETGHDYGNIEDTVEVVESLRKGPYLNTVGKM
jgi:hypothetical protein